MSAAVYVRCELLRALRNRRFFAPLDRLSPGLYLLIAGPNRNETDLAGSGIPAPLYFMIGLASFGTMKAVTAAGAGSGSSARNWTRQLRVTPLPPRVYFATKLAVAYATPLLTIAVLYVAGVSLDVHESTGRWGEMTGLMLVGLAPFAAGSCSGTCSTPRRSARPSAGRPRSWPSSAASGSPSATASSATSRTRCPPTGSSRPDRSASARRPGA